MGLLKGFLESPMKVFLKFCFFVLLFLQHSDVRTLWTFNLWLTSSSQLFRGFVVFSFFTIVFFSLFNRSQVPKNHFHRNLTVSLTKDTGENIQYTERGVVFSVDSWTSVSIVFFSWRKRTMLLPVMSCSVESLAIYSVIKSHLGVCQASTDPWPPNLEMWVWILVAFSKSGGAKGSAGPPGQSGVVLSAEYISSIVGPCAELHAEGCHDVCNLSMRSSCSVSHSPRGCKMKGR